MSPTPSSSLGASDDTPSVVPHGSVGTSIAGSSFQARVRLYFIVLGAMTAGIHATIVTARVVGDGHTFGRLMAEPDNIARLVLVAALAVAVLATSWGRLSRAALLGLDAGAAAAVAAFGLLGLPSRPLELRPELPVLLGIALLLLARAALVPSSARRTVLVGLLALVPLFVLAPLVYPPDLALGDVPMRRIARVTIFAFGAATLAVAAVTSDVIYRLRRTVGRAMRLGPYEVVRKIGEGGMGTVYEARHASLRRRTALKLMKSARLEGSLVARFEREAQLTGELTHPNTVALYDYGQTSDGIYYYAMEYIDGLTLDRLVRSSGPLPAGRVLHLLRQVAASLAQAHRLSLVHRDVKPANVMVCWRDGQPDLVKVLDFGLAKRLEAGGGRSARTSLVGTPQFMAPEAACDRASVGPATDVYAVGTIGYFLLTGEPLFEGHGSVSVANAHRVEPPLPPSLRTSGDVPRDLEEVLMRCLEKDPARRFADGAELLDALGRCRLGGWSSEEAERWWRLSEHGAPQTLETGPAVSADTRPALPSTQPFDLAKPARRSRNQRDDSKAGSAIAEGHITREGRSAHHDEQAWNAIATISMAAHPD